MTTNELKCPVCGEGMEYRSSGQKYYVCQTGGCLEEGVAYGKPKIDRANTLIQLRIDKEKAAAVQQERERVDRDLDKMEIFYQNNCPQNRLSCHATILSTIKEARKVVTKGIQQFNVT